LKRKKRRRKYFKPDFRGFLSLQALLSEKHLKRPHFLFLKKDFELPELEGKASKKNRLY